MFKRIMYTEPNDKKAFLSTSEEKDSLLCEHILSVSVPVAENWGFTGGQGRHGGGPKQPRCRRK